MKKFRVWAAGGIVAGLTFLFWVNAAPVGSHDGLIAVPPGTGAWEVVRRLNEEKQLRSMRWFRFLLKISGTGRRLHVGVYPLKKGSSAWDILRSLQGKSVFIRVTVPEGWTTAQVAERLGLEGVVDAGEFLSVVAGDEGFLFPATYEFEPYYGAIRARQAFLDRFSVAWRTAVSASSASLKDVHFSTVSVRGDRVRFPDGRWWTCQQVVALASIVEKEGGMPDQKPLVAAVYHNRLRKGMRLGADPTVQYALGRWKERLLYRDLNVDSPYNTYKRAGLPPGPIASPGLFALKAVLAPADSPVLYFVADGTGGHLFSRTYVEHLRNARAFRRLNKPGS